MFWIILSLIKLTELWENDMLKKNLLNSKKNLLNSKKNVLNSKKNLLNSKKTC